nr:hypothetical protein CFP56_75247 [Quercus suber]
MGYKICVSRRKKKKECPLQQEANQTYWRNVLLSLFGRLLSDRQQNQRALKSTLRSAWKMGSELKIVNVGNGILPFKFSSIYQLEWVENSGPWNFENNLLLLCRWEKGLSTANMVFTHSPFWVQLWGLPFEHMSEDTTSKQYGEWLKAGGVFKGNSGRQRSTYRDRHNEENKNITKGNGQFTDRNLHSNVADDGGDNAGSGSIQNLKIADHTCRGDAFEAQMCQAADSGGK